MKYLNLLASCTSNGMLLKSTKRSFFLSASADQVIENRISKEHHLTLTLKQLSKLSKVSFSIEPWHHTPALLTCMKMISKIFMKIFTANAFDAEVVQQPGCFDNS